jgi:hypothetical protein
VDPNATLAALRSAVEDGDLVDAFNLAFELFNWVFNGGFPPDDPKYREDINRQFRPHRAAVNWVTVDQIRAGLKTD